MGRGDRILHWSEHDIGGDKPWAVAHRADGAELSYARTPTGRIKRFGKRAHAWALAEKLNREEHERRGEVLRTLGL